MCAVFDQVYQPLWQPASFLTTSIFACLAVIRHAGQDVCGTVIGQRSPTARRLLRAASPYSPSVAQPINSNYEPQQWAAGLLCSMEKILLSVYVINAFVDCGIRCAPRRPVAGSSLRLQQGVAYHQKLSNGIALCAIEIFSTSCHPTHGRFHRRHPEHLSLCGSDLPMNPLDPLGAPQSISIH